MSLLQNRDTSSNLQNGGYRNVHYGGTNSYQTLNYANFMRSDASNMVSANLSYQTYSAHNAAGNQGFNLNCNYFGLAGTVPSNLDASVFEADLLNEMEPFEVLSHCETNNSQDLASRFRMPLV